MRVIIFGLYSLAVIVKASYSAGLPKYFSTVAIPDESINSAIKTHIIGKMEVDGNLYISRNNCGRNSNLFCDGFGSYCVKIKVNNRLKSFCYCGKSPSASPWCRCLASAGHTGKPSGHRETAGGSWHPAWLVDGCEGGEIYYLLVTGLSTARLYKHLTRPLRAPVCTAWWACTGGGEDQTLWNIEMCKHHKPGSSKPAAWRSGWVAQCQ